MLFVARNEFNAIVSLFSMPQHDENGKLLKQETLAEDDPEVIAFRNRFENSKPLPLDTAAFKDAKTITDLKAALVPLLGIKL